MHSTTYGAVHADRPADPKAARTDAPNGRTNDAAASGLAGRFELDLAAHCAHVPEEHRAGGGRLRREL